MNAAGAPPRADGAIGDYALVPATSIDHAALVAFTSAIWPEVSPEARINTFWWMRARPDYAVAALHRPTGAFAGLCGGRHCVFKIGGRDIPAVAICDWYVAPAHFGKGLGKRLVQHFETPGRFLYALSISDAAIANFEKLGWTGPHRSSLQLLLVPPTLARHLAPQRLSGELAFNCFERGEGEPLGALGNALDSIEVRRGSTAAHMRRDATEWTWLCVRPTALSVLCCVSEWRARRLRSGAPHDEWPHPRPRPAARRDHY